MVAFTPMFLFISASVNNDNLANFLSTVALWQLTAWLRRPPMGPRWSHFRLGLVLGAAALSKVSAVGLLSLTAALLAVCFLRVRRGPVAPSGARRGAGCPPAGGQRGLFFARHLGWVVLAGLVRWTSVTWASQGRLIFPAVGALSVMLAVGWTACGGSPRPGDRLHGRIGAVCAARRDQLPLCAAPRARAGADGGHRHAVDANFGIELLLLGYNLETEALRPGEAARLTLYWQSLAARDRNLSAFVHLVDDAGIIIAQRDRYPGQSALATTLLQSGQAFADAYVIPVSDTAFAPTAVQVVEVGLYDATTGQRLQLTNTRGHLTDADFASLSRILLLP